MFAVSAPCVPLWLRGWARNEHEDLPLRSFVHHGRKAWAEQPRLPHLSSEETKQEGRQDKGLMPEGQVPPGDQIRNNHRQATAWAM
jgi:hypothetical protein